MFRATRALLFAKTAVKEVSHIADQRGRSAIDIQPCATPTAISHHSLCVVSHRCYLPFSFQPTAKKPTTTATATPTKVKKVRDPSLPPLPVRFSLPQLIERIPKPAPDLERSEWQHKGGWGLKFYRAGWARYEEPCYWTVTRYKPKVHGHKRKVWGVLTWRGEKQREGHTIKDMVQ